MLHSSWRTALRQLVTFATPRPRRPVSLGRDNPLEDRVVPATVALALHKLRETTPPMLKAPAMPGLARMDLAIVGAIKRAWQLPSGTATAGWVVALPGGQTPDTLASLGAHATPTGIIPDTYVLRFDTPKDVATFGPQLTSQVAWAYPLQPLQMIPRFIPNDVLFHNQWHLLNTGQTGGLPGADAHVVPVWNNFDGSGVVIGIVDDGFQHSHPDLQPNYDAADSFDFVDGDSDPSPPSDNFRHGTAVGGVAAAQGNNRIGVSGAAFNASLAGLRLLGSNTNDTTESSALSYHNNAISIYNNSWGPLDTGRLGSIGPLTLAALQSGFTGGRNGLGNIFTWAAGNGGFNQDNVNYDGFANSRYVIAVSAIDHKGQQSGYSEPGAPILVAGYSDTVVAGAPGITTTALVGLGNVGPNYRNNFGGTSSAAPLVSGVIALILQANPNLTARDVQNILVRTAVKNDSADPGWTTNQAGYHINNKYGLGAINAKGAVAMAANWTPVPAQLQADSGVITVNKTIPDNNANGVSSFFTVTENFRIEHVEVLFNATHPYRGDLRLVLTAPSGTRSVLAATHVTDPGSDYTDWLFSTVRNWGEGSAGKWTLTVSDGAPPDIGTFNDWTLRIYGREFTPALSGLEATTLSFLENHPVAVTSSLTVSNLSGNPINDARITISNNFNPGEDVLNFTPQPGLTGVFDANTGILAISGSASVAQYQAALRSVQYDNLSENPSPFTRTISFRVTDSHAHSSDVVSRKVGVIPVNDAPSFFSGGDFFVDEDSVNPPFQAWATNILAGPGEEAQSNQIVNMELVSFTNPDLFSIPPDISPTGDVSFTLAANANGTSTVIVLARDNGGTANLGVNVSPAQSFQINVAAVNDAPFSQPDLFVVSEDGQLVVPAPGMLANDRDLEGSPMTATKLTDPTHGTLVTFSSNGSFTYKPDANFTGNDSFTYQVSDGLLNSPPTTVTLSVAPVNDAPTAVDDVASSDGHPVAIAVAANDTDADGDYLRVISYTAPSFGRVARLGNALVYTPVPGATGDDSFNYSIADGKGGFDSGTVTVNVTDAIAPNIQGVRLTYGSGATAVVDLAALSRNTLPWANITRFQFVLSEDVSVDPSALSLVGAEVGSRTLTFAYDPATHTATWSRPTGLPIDQYTLRLSGALVSDASANLLTADWAKVFAVLPGDFDGSGVVDDADLAGIQASFTLRGKTVNRWADIDGSGLVDATDLEIARGNKGKRA